MADKKISALTAASTPLAGTEVLPIVQSGATVKVATDDLTVRNFRANATTGILQVTGPAAASTRVMTVPNADFTAARTDAAQSFTGDQTLSTGNLVVSNGKGIDFSATPNTGTSELFADYEEGTYTPTLGGLSGGAITYTTQTGIYTKVGRQVTLYFSITVNTNTNTGGNTFVSVPFASGTAGFVGPLEINSSSNASLTHVGFFTSNAEAYFYTAGGGTLDGSAIGNGCVLSGSLTYFV
jgi:hypothetical protein